MPTNNYRTYIINTSKRTEQLDTITQLAGRIYSKTVSLIHKVKDNKDFWLSQGGAKKYLKFMEYPCHAHSVQAIIDDYYGALKSFFQRQKKTPKPVPHIRQGNITHLYGERVVYLLREMRSTCLWGRTVSLSLLK